MPSSLDKDHPLFALMRASRKRVLRSSAADECTNHANGRSALSFARDQGNRAVILENGTDRSGFSLDW
jgi:hypothetical protein